jgi:DNA-binding XRE family transcriptional regulator
LKEERRIQPETERIIFNLRVYRQHMKMSVPTLASHVDISRSHLFYIENGDCVPSLDVIIKMAKAMGTTIGELETRGMPETYAATEETRRKEPDLTRAGRKQAQHKSVKTDNWPGSLRGWGSLTRGTE